MSRIGWRFASVFCALTCALASQPGLQREVLDLSKIKRKMVENLSKLPDYTCVETVERSARQTQTATFRAVDSRFSGIQVAIQSDDSASA